MLASLVLLLLCVVYPAVVQAQYVWPQTRPGGWVYTENAKGSGRTDMRSDGGYPEEWLGVNTSNRRGGGDLWECEYDYNGVNVANLIPKCHSICGVAMLYPTEKHCYRQCPKSSGTCRKNMFAAMRCEIREPCSYPNTLGGVVQCPPKTIPVELYDPESPLPPEMERQPVALESASNLRNDFRFMDKTAAYGGSVDPGKKVPWACMPLPGLELMDMDNTGSFAGTMPMAVSRATTTEPGERDLDRKVGDDAPVEQIPDCAAGEFYNSTTKKCEATSPCPSGQQQVCTTQPDPGCGNCISNLSEYCLMKYCHSTNSSSCVDNAAYINFQQCSTKQSPYYDPVGDGKLCSDCKTVQSCTCVADPNAGGGQQPTTCQDPGTEPCLRWDPNSCAYDYSSASQFEGSSCCTGSCGTQGTCRNGACQ